MSFEFITLVGGPADGQTMSWDGGDYVLIQERPDVKLRPLASETFKKLFVKQHLYKREPRTVTFNYQGEA